MKNLLKPLRKSTDYELRKGIESSWWYFGVYYFLGVFVLLLSMFTLHTIGIIAGTLSIIIGLHFSSLNQQYKIRLEIRQMKR